VYTFWGGPLNYAVDFQGVHGDMSINYLGLRIEEGQISMDPLKINGIIQWPTPERVHNVQAFLGFCNFYQWFIKDYSALAKPLFDLTKKNTPFQWGEH